MTDRTLKTGDSFPPHIRVLEDDDGPIDLAGALQVRILARQGATLISDICTVMTIQAALDTGFLRGSWNAADLNKMSAVSWDIAPADTAIAGAYSYEYEIQWTIDDIETIPNAAAANPVLTINQDLDT